MQAYIKLSAEISAGKKDKILHRRATVCGRVAHDDTFRHTCHAVRLAPCGCVEQMIGRLLEGCQHQDAVLHLRDTETSDTQNLALDLCLVPIARTHTGINAYLIGHYIAEQHNMSGIDAHSVRAHGVLNLVNDGQSCGFDTQNLSGFDNVVGRSLFADDTCRQY